jgi:hypothetical protein
VGLYHDVLRSDAAGDRVETTTHLGERLPQ